MDITAIEQQRDEVLEAMREIRRMRRGSVSEQWMKVPHKGEKEPALRGPYGLWQCYRDGKPERRRLKTPEEVERAKREVANYKRFQELCREYEDLTGCLGALELEAGSAQEALKKGLKSRSNRASKLGG